MNQSNRKKYMIWKVILAIIALLILTIGIPIIINEAYKYGSLYGGYITAWDAAVVLSYYGTVLGATATATAMVVTITFTRKQIYRDSYLKNEREKWSKIEFVFADALNNINPIRPLMETMDTSFIDPSMAIRTIQKYQIACKTATDQLNACLNAMDYPKVKPIIDAISGFANEIDQTLQNAVKEYSKLRDFKHRSTAHDIVKIESRSPGSFPKEDITLSERILKDTNETQLDDIQKAIEQLNERIIAIYYGTYHSLLQLKGSTFETINTEIQQKADCILLLWGKK